nr:TetR/AcrR family transcriptional regulator [Oceanococcus sp. HetDA_MAG_MS8]
MSKKTPSKGLPPCPASLRPATRRRVEQAVLDIFSRQEFHKVSLSEVAKQAQVSLQTIYKYYGSKEFLLFATIDAMFSGLAARMIEHLQGIETFADKLRKVIWVMFDYFERHPRLAQVVISSVYLNSWARTDAFRQPELTGVFLKVLRDGREAGVLTDEVDELVIMDVIIGIVARRITMSSLRHKAEPLTAQTGPIFNMVWRAITPPPRLAV